MSSLPFAVLDSGAGGLSVAKAIKRLLPHETIYYFADTAHLPYGIKSPELIKKLVDQLIHRIKGISSYKAVVVACHTMSVLSLEEIKAHFSVPVIGMVNPSLACLKDLIATRKISSIGILSTKATLSSGVYRNAWSMIEKETSVTLVEQACGPLVSLVEEEDVKDFETTFLLDYFLTPEIKQCDAILMGCTHFSALIPAIRQVVKPGSFIVDAADFVARATRSEVETKSPPLDCKEGEFISFVSDNPKRFANIARSFMGHEIPVHLMRD